MESEELYCCPLTKQIYKKPVVTKYGHTYEKEMIVKHLKTKNVDPLTNQRLTINDLFPNRSLEDLINLYLSKHPEKKEEQYVECEDINETTINNNSVVEEYVPPRVEQYVVPRVEQHVLLRHNPETYYPIYRSGSNIKKGSKKGSGRMMKKGSKKMSGKRMKKGSGRRMY